MIIIYILFAILATISADISIFIYLLKKEGEDIWKQ